MYPKWATLGVIPADSARNSADRSFIRSGWRSGWFFDPQGVEALQLGADQGMNHLERQTAGVQQFDVVEDEGGLVGVQFADLHGDDPALCVGEHR